MKQHFTEGQFKGKARPTERLDEIQEAVVDELLPAILTWYNVDPSTEYAKDIRRELASALKCNGTSDGYTIAKALDDDGWSSDSDLVEILDVAWHHTHSITQEAVLRWIADNGIAPKFSINDGVFVVYRGTRHAGQVVEIRNGQYTVMVSALGHVKEGLGTHGFCFDWEQVEGWNAQEKPPQ